MLSSCVWRGAETRAVQGIGALVLHCGHGALVHGAVGAVEVLRGQLHELRLLGDHAVACQRIAAVRR